MFQAQGLERQLAIILATKYRPGPNRITRTEFDKILRGLFLRTLGWLVEEIGKVAQLNEDEKERLQKALNKRNWLAHHYFWERALDFQSESGRALMMEELQEAAELFQALDELITNRTLKWAEEVGVTRQELDKTLEQLMKDTSI